MSSRRNKLPGLSEHAREKFIEDATATHKTVNGYQMSVRTSSPHYRALWKLHDAILDAIKEVTGKEAPWIGRSNS